MLEAAQDRLRTEAWLQRQKDKAIRVCGSVRGTRSSFASLEVEQDYIVIEDVNPPSKMKMIVLPSKESARRSTQPAIQLSSLPLFPLNQEGSLIQPAKTTPERPELERTFVSVAEPESEPAISESEIAPRALQCPNQPLPQPLKNSLLLLSLHRLCCC